MIDKNLGVRCAHYLNIERKSLRRENLSDQDKLCIVCRGVDSKYCNLYYPLYDLESFKKLFYKNK